VANLIGVSVKITGNDDMGAAIENALSQFAPEMLGVMVEEGEEIMAASKEIVPLDDDVLRPSGGLYGTEEAPNRVAVLLGYGGAASSYARVQHETPPNVYSHSEGRTWKYLERPVFDAAKTMGPRLASRLSARITSRFAGGGGGASGGGGTFGSGGD